MKRYLIKNTSKHVEFKENVKLEYLTPFLSQNVLYFR